MNRSSLLAAAVIVLSGCSSYREVPRGDLVSGSSQENVRVATVEGFEYKFERVEVAADTLFGFYPVTVERVGPGKQIWYEDSLRRQAIALAQVARIDLVRRDPLKTAIWGASIGAAGYFLVNLVDESSRKSSLPGSGGKPPP